MSTKLINARKGDKFRADQIDYSDIGKTIRVELTSGAIVTDRIVGSSSHDKYAGGPLTAGVIVVFANVSPSGMFGPGFEVDPSAIVTVTKLAEPK